MRARGIKPGICDNELLGTADPFYTLLFERLWMMADREGRLEDRPLRIKAQAFPYRDGLDVEPMLQWLHDNGFIHRYRIGPDRYIQVTKFAEHQSPHVKEAASKIPAPFEHQTSPVQAPDKPGAPLVLVPEIPAPAHLTPSSLTPDSGLLTADSGSLRSRNARARARGEGEAKASERIVERLREAYPRGIFRESDWLIAEREARMRLDEGHSAEELIEGCRRYAKQCEAKGSVGTQYVESPKKFFTLPECKFRDPFPLPVNGGRTHPEDTGWRPTE